MGIVHSGYLGAVPFYLVKTMKYLHFGIFRGSAFFRRCGRRLALRAATIIPLLWRGMFADGTARRSVPYLLMVLYFQPSSCFLFFRLSILEQFDRCTRKSNSARCRHSMRNVKSITPTSEHGNYFNKLFNVRKLTTSQSRDSPPTSIVPFGVSKYMGNSANRGSFTSNRNGSNPNAPCPM